jgi:hypothetical protein
MPGEARTIVRPTQAVAAIITARQILREQDPINVTSIHLEAHQMRTTPTAQQLIGKPIPGTMNLIVSTNSELNTDAFPEDKTTVSTLLSHRGCFFAMYLRTHRPRSET